MPVRTFEVEGAGCETCAVRVRAALDGLAAVETVEIDEARDVAIVSLAQADDLDEAQVNAVLENASVGSGHAYRVASGTWGAAS